MKSCITKSSGGPGPGCATGPRNDPRRAGKLTLTKRRTKEMGNGTATVANGKHSDYQLLPPLTPEERAALKESIRQHGVMMQIEKDEHGNVLDGHHRLELVEELRA